VSGPTPNASAPAGTTQTVKVAGGMTSTCNIDESVVRPLLDKPARNLSLWEAAHVVALLHLQGRIKLKGTPYPQYPNPPVFKTGCSELVYPGPNPRSNGRFTVALEEAFFISGGRKVPFEYVKSYASVDKKGNVTPLKSFVQFWFALDVRLVVVLHHLVAAFEKLEKRGIKVAKVLHSGMGAVHETRFKGTLFDKASGKTFPREIIIDNHLSGRAIDFVGVVLEDGETFTVLEDWGQAEVPQGTRASGAPKPDRWPVYDSVKNGSDWVDVNWKNCPPDHNFESADARLKANAAGRGSFSATHYRLRDDLPAGDGPATTRKQRAAVIFLEAFEAFFAHCTLKLSDFNKVPADDSFPPRGALGNPSPLGTRDDHGALIHPETLDPILRETHRDHIHAQVGHTGYEYPDAAAQAADKAAAEPHRLPDPKDGVVWDQAPNRIGRKGAPIPGAVTPPK
jgi:hypothetical protein